MVTMAWVGKEGYRAAISYENASRQIAASMEAEHVAKLKLKEWASTLTLGMVHNDLRQKLERLSQERSRSAEAAKRWMEIFSGLSLLALLSAWLMAPRPGTGLLSAAALMALVNGLVTPILMVTVHKNVEYLGDVVLSFESKGILGSIHKLYAEGNLPVAGVILLFSVLLPALKTLSLLFLSLYETRPFAAKMVHFFKALGKWSMLDVFIVALLLVFLTSRESDVSRAEAEIGIYFFLAYVILSMAASIRAERMLQKAK